MPVGLGLGLAWARPPLHRAHDGSIAATLRVTAGTEAGLPPLPGPGRVRVRRPGMMAAAAPGSPARACQPEAQDPPGLVAASPGRGRCCCGGGGAPSQLRRHGARAGPA